MATNNGKLKASWLFFLIKKECYCLSQFPFILVKNDKMKPNPVIIFSKMFFWVLFLDEKQENLSMSMIWSIYSGIYPIYQKDQKTLQYYKAPLHWQTKSNQQCGNLFERNFYQRVYAEVVSHSISEQKKHFKSKSITWKTCHDLKHRGILSFKQKL